MTKLLILRSAEIFFPKGEHIYKYLAKKFGKLEEYDKLNKAYQDGKIKGPCFLKETVETVLKGVSIREFTEDCIEYVQLYLNLGLIDFLDKAKKKEYEIASFCSFPRAFFMEAICSCHLSFPVFVYGVVSKTEKDKIIGLQDLKFEDEEFVRREMEKIGFGDKFTRNPDRYGMLEKLIELIRDKGFRKEDIVLIGNSVTAKPTMKLAGRVIKKFSDLNKVAEKL